MWQGTLLVSCLIPGTGAAVVGNGTSFLANWMGLSQPVFANLTLLDLALPGSHDTMTYDLSTALSDGYEDMPGSISKILHDLTPLVAGEFIRDQGRTQGTNITSQLEGGLRFIDFRTLYSSGKKGKKDWFSLHGCQTNSPSLDYLKQVRQWLDLHPHEMVVFWISRHGDVSLNGTKQYPGTTVAQRRAYWAQIEAVFEGKLVDSTHGALNEVTMAEHWSRGAQVVIYATDYAEFTGSASTAIDAMHVDNQLGGSSIEHIPKGMKDALGVFSPGTRRSDKASNRFYLVSMANSGPQVGEAAEYKYVPFAQKGAIKSCEKIFGIPNMTGWCPLTLMDVGSLGNYYNQQVLEQVYTTMAKDRSNGRATLQFEFPNAIYIDGIGNTASTGAPGTLHTGIAQVCGAGATCTTTLPMPSKSLPHADTAYAYAATVVGSNFLKLCPSDATATGDGSAAVSAAAAAACATNMAQITQLRQTNPLKLWDEPKYGRVTAPPSTWPQQEGLEY